MKKVFSNRLVFKLGLFISATVLSLTNLVPIISPIDSSQYPENSLAALWTIGSQNPGFQIMDDSTNPLYEGSIDFDLNPSRPSANSHWEQETSDSKNASPHSSHVLFSIDQPSNSSASASSLLYDDEGRDEDWLSPEISELAIPEQLEYPFKTPQETSSSFSKLSTNTSSFSLPEENSSADTEKDHFPEIFAPVNTSPYSYDEHVRPKAYTQESAVLRSNRQIAVPKLIAQQDVAPAPGADAAPLPANIPSQSNVNSAPKGAANGGGQPASEGNAPSPSPIPPSPPQNEVLVNPEPAANEPIKSILINFNNVAMIEYLRFISRITNKNFVFDENDLQFNVTIVSEEPTSLENIMAALIQELRIHDLTLIEQGNNLIIHKNPKVSGLSKVISDDLPDPHPSDAEIVTQVFRLNTLEPEKAATIIRPLVSSMALVEFITDPNHLIVTDIVTNVQQIGKLLRSLDAPNSGLVIGQYVARTTDIETLLPLAQRIMSPISQEHTLLFVPYYQANSIFIVSSPFLVERSISILQHLDQDKGKTRIFDLKDLKYDTYGTREGYPGGPGGPGRPGQMGAPGEAPGGPGGRGGPYTGPGGAGGPGYYPEGHPGEYYPEGQYPGGIPGEAGGWQYGPSRSEYERQWGGPAEETPEQRAARERCQNLPKLTSVGMTTFEPAEKISRQLPTNPDFVAKPLNKVKFYIHKMQYRRGDIILDQVRRIGESLRYSKGNDELLGTIDTAQFLEDAKAIVVSGTPENLEKVKELIEQLDIPLRQVYIEMLILQTTVNDSLNFSCNFANRFGGGNQAGSQGFLSGASPLQGTMDSTGVNLLGSPAPNPGTSAVPFNNRLIPDPTNLAKSAGFNLGILGQTIIHKGLGLEFNSIGALVKAEHDRNVSKIVLSPKIITEDNVPAYIFVGINTPFQTQAVANNNGNIITNNFEFRDVGTSLQVTPHLTNSDIITLELIEERTAIATPATPSQNTNLQIAPTTAKSTTKTTVNVPDGYFVIISGMLENETVDNVIQVPCLGSIPLIGGGFKDRADQLNRRNLMIFIRPQIIDTDEEIQNITRHGQDVWEYKNALPKMWVEEAEGALDYFNVRRTMNTDDEDDPEVHQFAH